ncbi:precorrin-6A/cobalt-precorrin-6A reductase [Kribbella voronezhensis]|uniref:Precorrin-6A/cobalt-precorrin-6A reductase n=1 Tax=Kribbella voronezhensis TaxID=2512212 RepID=A0A4V3FKX9_9ACTN|nr:precorrin-6A/cobalt-precorrin-6A reductase [Kribbella voronezhensis]TDU91883.1 precorrin-6A/cobalt-precorrin-6A reductase [Kribbella voronezhensis]
MKILLLGGTGEARRLAELLAREPGLSVVSSLAGRTTEARLPEGAVRQGGFGGVAGLVDWVKAHEIDVVVDATHPFAATMTEHAAEAARLAGVELLVLRRAGWREQAGDRWAWVDTPEEAARILPGLGKRAFVTIGRQGLHAFAAAAVPPEETSERDAAAPDRAAEAGASAGVWMLARCVDPPEPVPSWCEVVLDRGPYAVQDELELLRDRRIDVLVTKDSGGPMTSAKLEAARALGIPVVVIRRPPLPAGVTAVETVDQVVGRLTDRR